MDSANRRNYFRIDDELVLSYQILDQQEYQQHKQEYRQERIQAHQQQEMEHRIHSSIRSVQIKYPELGDILILLNQKIEQLAHGSSDSSSTVSDEVESRAVNISASGIAFFQDTPLDNNTALEMTLNLSPDEDELKLFAVVVDCAEQKTVDIEHYKISVEFEYVIEEDRDDLVHYIMKQQNLALRKNSGIDDDFE